MSKETNNINPLLNKIKLRLRIIDDDFDDEINDLIEAAIIELNMVGVNKKDFINDPLVINAISLYCKAYFGVANPDSERYIESFNSMRIHLTLVSNYIVSEGDIKWGFLM